MISNPITKSFPEVFKTIIIPPEDNPITLELREYYADFFLPECYVKAEIVSSKTLQGIAEKFTVYVVEVKLPFARYSIEKRYSKFFDFYQKIDHKYKNIGLESTMFPSRKLFGSFNQATIEHRKLHLNRFLDFLCKIYKNEGIIEFLEFLEIKNLIERVDMLRRNLLFDPIPRVLDHSDILSLEDEQALGFLLLFNKKPKVLCKLFKEFDFIFFIEKRPKLSKQTIKKLFCGYDDFKGLVHICGNFDFKTDLHVTCGSGLNLLVKLLDHEYNKEAEYYNKIFGSLSFRDISCLYFENHIQGKGLKSCKAAALKLLYIFMNHNPSIAITLLLSNEEAIQEYETWKLSQQVTSIKAENYNKYSCKVQIFLDSCCITANNFKSLNLINHLFFE